MNKRYSRNTNIRIDWNKLLRMCQVSNFDRLASEYGAYELPGKSLKNTWFIDRGANILAVAHFDTVSRGAPSVHLLKTGKRVVGIKSIQLDDRLGAYILLDLLPTLGIYCDVLITDDEEIGQSTAAYFVNPTNRKYNWIFSFDRHDDKPVAYDYEFDKEWAAAIEKIMELDWGTFSDICDLEHLGVCGVNWGTGYKHEHTDKCRAYADEIEWCVYTFSEFYWRNHDQKYTHTPRPSRKGYSRDAYWYRGEVDYYGRQWFADMDKDTSSTKSGPAAESAKAFQEAKTKAFLSEWPKRTPEMRTDEAGDPEYLCEFCWNYQDEVSFSQVWNGWLCDSCLIDLSEGRAVHGGHEHGTGGMGLAGGG